MGAIFMAANTTALSHTKHVDEKYKCLNEYVKDGLVTIVFLKSDCVKSAENYTNVIIKNLDREFHANHSKKL